MYENCILQRRIRRIFRANYVRIPRGTVNVGGSGDMHGIVPSIRKCQFGIQVREGEGRGKGGGGERPTEGRQNGGLGTRHEIQ
jgi:hypothetical protein